MLDTGQQKSTHRFAVFDFYAATGELWKRGIRLKCQQQPRQILGILLERAGEVVTREDLQHTIWPGDVYVDFDTAINSAIRKLREALGDTADSPGSSRPSRAGGYRFIAPVSRAAPQVLTEPVPVPLLAWSPDGRWLLTVPPFLRPSHFVR
jgi:DNA-binding winged helix-turn-helix (wHTH) protein